METHLLVLGRCRLILGTSVCVAAALALCAATAWSQAASSARVVHDPRAQEFVVTVGPIPLHGAAEGHAHHETHAYSAAVPVDGWLRGYEVEIADGSGRKLPRQLLHHLNLMVPGERELFTPIMRRIGAAGRKTGVINAPPGVGYPIQRGDTLLITVMLHNPTGHHYDAAFARVRLRYTPASTRLPMLAVYPFYLDVLMRPGARSYDLPPGRSEVSWEGSPAVSGRILGISGHLHKHAVLLRLEDVSAGKVLWETRPHLDRAGEVVAMPVETFLLRLGLPLHAEHAYRITAIYDNPTGRIIPRGGMGALGGIFVPSRGSLWPAVARSDPIYALDRQITIDGISDPPADRSHKGHAAHQHR